MLYKIAGWPIFSEYFTPGMRGTRRCACHMVAVGIQKCYLDGIGVAADYTKARVLLRLAIEGLYLVSDSVQ